MRLIRGWRQLNHTINGCVVTLGNYDGLHLGHQQLLHELAALGRSKRLPNVVITFEPSPKEFFQKNKTTSRLMSFSEKWMELKKYDIDYVLIFRFNEAFARLSPEAFVKKILVDQLNVKAIVVGGDFRFGAKRAGDFSLLKKMGNELGFEAFQSKTMVIDNQRVSSTRVREALKTGDLQLAQSLLGRPYRLRGKVVHGDKRGRQLGVRTANLNRRQRALLLSGIFVVKVYGLNDGVFEGVASLGVRPTFDDPRVVLEVHLFDYSKEIYGKTVEVEFLKKLRDEVRYEKIEDLVKQMRQDIDDAKHFFNAQEKRR